jgi:hypothetical protein
VHDLKIRITVSKDGEPTYGREIIFTEDMKELPEEQFFKLAYLRADINLQLVKEEIQNMIKEFRSRRA